MTDHNTDPERIAHFVAGNAAYQIVAKHGIEIGAAILRGYFRAFTLALVALDGRESVARRVDQIIASSIPKGSRPHLAVDNAPEQSEHVPGAA